MKKEDYFAMDCGIYNNAIRGYLIEAMKNAGFSREDICKALGGLNTAFDEMDARDAEENYIEF